DMPAPQAASAAADAPTTAQLASSAATYTDAQRKFIRTAHAEFKVKDVYQSALAIEDVVAAHGGFVVKNDVDTQVGVVQRRPKGGGKLLELAEYTVHGSLTVRVPSDRTQEFLRAIVTQMEFLDGRSFEARDAQFELLRQQLAWRRNQEAQQDIGVAVEGGGKLGQKADAISARNDAKSARDEALIAQKEFEDRVAFSTIELSLHQSPRIRQTELIDTEAVFAQNSPGFFNRLGNALNVGWYGVLDVLLALMQVWPLWLLIAAGIWAWRRWRRK
ncbi:MAG TPA: DUF4349 domain-containing protein, partial [Pseudoxanthomonas sp.]|nr:DUF4349 domain-containing protein [Pseudoxanthomonas sp.]